MKYHTFEFAQQKRGGTQRFKRNSEFQRGLVRSSRKVYPRSSRFWSSYWRSFKLVWIKRPQPSVEGVQEVKVKPKY